MAAPPPPQPKPILQLQPFASGNFLLQDAKTHGGNMLLAIWKLAVSSCHVFAPMVKIMLQLLDRWLRCPNLPAITMLV